MAKREGMTRDSSSLLAEDCNPRAVFRGWVIGQMTMRGRQFSDKKCRFNRQAISDSALQDQDFSLQSICADLNLNSVAAKFTIRKCDQRQAKTVIFSVVASIRDLNVIDPWLHRVEREVEKQVGTKEVSGGQADQKRLVVDRWGRKWRNMFAWLDCIPLVVR